MATASILQAPSRRISLQEIMHIWFTQPKKITICHSGVFLLLVVDLAGSLPTGYTASFSCQHQK
jgi:hypothetical protein